MSNTERLIIRIKDVVYIIITMLLFYFAFINRVEGEVSDRVSRKEFLELRDKQQIIEVEFGKITTQLQMINATLIEIKQDLKQKVDK